MAGRTTRVEETRTAETRTEDPGARPYEGPNEWTPPQALDTPPAREGMVQKWIRKSLMGKEDRANVNMRLREGWRPRELGTMGSVYKANGERQDDADYLEVGGLILCEIPERLAQQRNQFYQKRARTNERAVAAEVRNVEDPDMPITQSRKSEVDVRTPKVQS